MNKKIMTIVAGCAIVSTLGYGIGVLKSMNDQIASMEDKLASKEKAINYHRSKVEAYNDYSKDSICKMIDEIAPQYNIPTDFAKAIISIESNFDSTASLENGLMAGVAMKTRGFARKYGLVVDDGIDERITEPEKLLHAVFKDLNLLRIYVEKNTGKKERDALEIAYSLQCQGIGRYAEVLSEGVVPDCLTYNKYLSALRKAEKHFQ